MQIGSALAEKIEFQTWSIEISVESTYCRGDKHTRKNQRRSALCGFPLFFIAELFSADFFTLFKDQPTLTYLLVLALQMPTNHMDAAAAPLCTFTFGLHRSECGSE